MAIFSSATNWNIELTELSRRKKEKEKDKEKTKNKYQPKI